MIIMFCILLLLILFYLSCKQTKNHTQKIKETKRVLKEIKKALKHK